MPRQRIHYRRETYDFPERQEGLESAAEGTRAVLAQRIGASFAISTSMTLNLRLPNIPLYLGERRINESHQPVSSFYIRPVGKRKTHDAGVTDKDKYNY